MLVPIGQRNVPKARQALPKDEPMRTIKLTRNLKTLSRWFSDDSLTKKAYLNAIAAALDYGAGLLIGFIITPFMVSGLGDYLYGVWRTLERLITYISPASGRATQALKRTIANQQASTDEEEKRRQVGNAVAVWFLFLPLLIVLGGSLVWFAPSWLKASAELAWTVRLAAGLLVANLIMVSLVEVPRSVLQGENLGYKRMGLSAILVFVGGGFTALALYLKTGLVGIAAAALATALLTGAVFLQVVRAYVPWFGIARPSFEAVRRFFGLSWWFLVWNLVMKLLTASDLVLLGLLDSMESVTTYSLIKYAPETLTSLVAIMIGGITPGLGGILGSGNLRKAAHIRSEIMSLTWLVATVVGATTLLWNPTFVRLWVGAQYYVGPIPSLLIMLMVTQFVLIRNDAFIIDLTLDLRRKVQLGAVSAIASLILAGILVKAFNMGITGLCLGFIAGRSVLSLAYPGLVGRFLGISLFSQLKSVLRPALTSVLLFALMLGISEFLAASTWMGLVLAAGVTLVMVLLVASHTGLSRDQRKRMLQRVRL